MTNHATDHKLSTASRTLLVAGLRAKKLLFSPLLKWYIEHGLLFTRIYEVVEYNKQNCFSNFVEFVTAARREGDKDKSKEVLAALCKLLGKSAFGGSILDCTRFLNIIYESGVREACISVNNPRFLSLTELGDDLYEIELNRSNINMNLPMQIGFAILNYAKMYLLSFYYDFLFRFIGRDDFEFMECDTDSTYIALKSPTLNECVLPEMRETFDTTLKRNCSPARYGPNKDNFLCRMCCAGHNKFDTRTPGLVKLEWSGTKMICLCSKSYVSSSGPIGKVKFSLKGLSKSNFVDPTNIFEHVLKTLEQ